MLQHPQIQFDGQVCRDPRVSFLLWDNIRSCVFEPDPIENLDRPACIFDEPAVLQSTSNFAYGCSLRADHLGQKLLRQLEQRVPSAILDHQEPAGKPSGYIVKAVATRRPD